MASRSPRPTASGQQGVGALQLYLALAAAAFGVLALLAWSIPYFPADVTIERAVQAEHPGWLETLASAVSWVGFPPQSTIIFGIIIAAIFVSGRRREAGLALFAAAGSAALWFLIAPLVHRPRPSPDLVRVAANIPFGSFPSGHVLNLTAFFGCLAYLAFTRLPSGWLRTLIVVCCAALVVGIGFARIYSGEHWPSDVLGGYLLGSVWLALAIRLDRWRARRTGVSPEPARASPT